MASSQEQEPIAAVMSPGPRRSTRVARLAAATPAAAAASSASPASNAQQASGNSSRAASKEATPSSQGRRNPKRKASEAVGHADSRLPDELLEEALRPLTAEDIRDWEGWVELESEPAFFNIILRDLGVKDVKAQEIFSIDQASLDFLPRPVYGLIFLFQYGPGGDESEGDDDTGSLWFANQTTHNSCATVALLNIVMNAGQVELGSELAAFKASTRDLGTALRGHELSRNKFIRTIHNSFTRRMDHLNADLALEDEASSAETAAAKRRAGRGRAKVLTTKGRKTPADEYGYHFIAYVPADGYVWELDGLKSKPRRIGVIEPQAAWTTIARPRIEDRIIKYQGSELSFNLLALCQSPLAMHARAIAQALAALRRLEQQIAQRPDLADPADPSTDPSDEQESRRETHSFLSRSLDEQQLAEFNLSGADVDSAPIPDCVPPEISHLERSAVLGLRERLVVDAKSAMGEFRAERMSMEDDELRVKGRRKDYGRSLHRWVRKLAEKNVLEEVIQHSCP
ncbi:Ubiquitin carboxyl-terminal hydrolase isozyme L5 [Escovopsis weberi]|uniref:Ubiquitin carboxyl-terminal hydrolase n=1 Tax=Escovopsis weberi TaxID=150374 RepID=A0A0M9VSU9_ESCWE|nr:Ubiquitin carboxyl-terminal hydrolase isozyme L5 [Escovopsis weberi]